MDGHVRSAHLIDWNRIHVVPRGRRRFFVLWTWSNMPRLSMSLRRCVCRGSCPPAAVWQDRCCVKCPATTYLSTNGLQRCWDGHADFIKLNSLSTCMLVSREVEAHRRSVQMRSWSPPHVISNVEGRAHRRNDGDGDDDDDDDADKCIGLPSGRSCRRDRSVGLPRTRRRWTAVLRWCTCGDATTANHRMLI